MKNKRSSGRSGKKFIFTVIAIAAVVVVLGIIGSQTSSIKSKGIASQDSSAISGNKLALSSLISGGSPVRGDRTASVTIIEFGDFQCPNCARFARNTEPELEKEYFATGKANMVFKHTPIRGPDSVTASMAAQCAGDQGKFWEFHDILYSNQGTENSGWASADNMKKFASELDLERNEFDSCLGSGKYRSFVDNDFAFARELGVSGTPSFVVVKSDGSEPEGILGAQPLSSFKAVLDKKIGNGE